MTRPFRRRALGAALIGAVMFGTLAVALPASADNTQNYFASPGTVNSSDPYVFRCNQYGYAGWCMVTSEDLGIAPIKVGQPGENYYPMDRTLMRFSRDGLKWSAPSVVSDETYMRTKSGYKVANADHMWAPAVRRVGLDSDNYGTQRLYVPGLTNANNKYSSRIFTTAWQSNPTNNPFYNPPGFSFLGGDPGVKEVTGAPAGLYMSDPDVFSDAVNWQTDTSKDYLLWADGDFGNCGGLSMRKMTSSSSIQPFTDPVTAQVKVTGFPSNWNCTPAGSANPHPYFEGASLYNMSNFRWTSAEGKPTKYTMVFAVKPKTVPTECSSSVGETNSNFEAIAYATASTVTGPYTYQGIIMCGSTTEWTNQAALMEVQGANGEWRLVLVHHDGKQTGNSTTPRNRQLHAECLYTVNGKFIKTMRAEGISTLSGSKQWCLANEHIRAMKSVSNGKYVSSKTAGLTATATYIGPWEQFSMAQSGASDLRFNSRNGSKWVSSDRNNGKIIADRTSAGAWEMFTPVKVSGDIYRFKDSQGKYWQVQSDGSLKAGSTAPSATDTSYQFVVEYLTQ